MHPYLKSYIKLVEFLGEALGDNVEIALHDLLSKSQPIVAISNGKISERQMGDGLTNLAIHMIEKKQYEDHDYVFNYKTVGEDGRLLRGSTWFIKDDNQKLIGMMCINVDISDYAYIDTTLKKILGIKDEKQVEFSMEHPIEILSYSLGETVDKYIKECLMNMGFPGYFVAKRLKVDEKIKVVKYLQEKGTFKIKGALSYVANQLGVSEPTIYRYLKKD